MTWRSSCVTGLVLCGSLVLQSCSAFLPAHSKSEALNESCVEVQMVTFKELEKPSDDDLKRFQEDYKATFGTLEAHVDNLPGGAHIQGVGVAAAAAGLVVGAAIDYVKGRIDEEAQRYEAQFSHTAAKDGFWFVSDHTAQQRYAGFIIRRKLEDDAKGAPAFQCAFGFAPSKDKQLFRLEPLSFITRKAKAKVLSDSLLWNLLPTTWFRYVAGTVGHSIDSEVAVEIDGYYRGKDQEPHIVKTASVQWSVTSYDLDKNLFLRRSSDGSVSTEGTLHATDSGWFSGVPLSQSSSGAPLPESGEAGAFVVKVTVTERDTSNAKRYLEKASKLVADNKDRVMKLVVPTSGSSGSGGGNAIMNTPTQTEPKK